MFKKKAKLEEHKRCSAQVCGCRLAHRAGLLRGRGELADQVRRGPGGKGLRGKGPRGFGPGKDPGGAEGPVGMGPAGEGSPGWRLTGD